MTKLLEVVRFELRYQARRPWTWLFIAALFVITMMIVTQAYIREARQESFDFNGPLVIMVMTTLGSLFGLLALASFTGDAAARDVHSGMFPLVYTSSLRKPVYLAGRLVAAIILGVLAGLAVQAALLVSTLHPDVTPELLRPFDPSLYLATFAVIALPNTVVATSLMFAMSALSRRAIAAYLGGVLLFFTSIVSWLLIAVKMQQWDVAKLLDPMGMVMASQLSRAMTSAQKNALALWSEPSFLMNRAIWLTVAAVILVITFRAFRMAQPSGVREKRRNDDERVVVPKAIAPPNVAKSFGAEARVRQILTIAAQSFRQVAFSWGGLVLATLTTILVILGASAMNHIDVPIIPTTVEMIDFVGNTGELVWNVVPIVTVFYVGELLWRDRETRIDEITDAAPVPESVRFAGRFLGIVAVLVGYQLLLIAGSMAIQAQLGYFRFELGLYARVLLGLMLTEHVLFAAMAFAVHVLVNHKYAGHMVVLVALGLTANAPALGLEHNMLVYDNAPEWSYSDMRGFGGTVLPWASFKAWWAGWAMLLAILTRLFWVRGKELGLRTRVRTVRNRVNRQTLVPVTVALAFIVVAGGFTFYNTNILNTYVTGDMWTERRAEYEKRYKHLEDRPRPTIDAIDLRVELHPSRRYAEIRGHYRLVNASTGPIDTIHVSPSPGIATPSITFDRPGEFLAQDRRLGFTSFALGTPLASGDSVRLDFHVEYRPRGFTNTGVDVTVTPNATFFEAQSWLPSIGYQPGREIGSPLVRQEHGLPPRQTLRTLEDSAARFEMRGLPLVSFEAVVGTDSGQTAVAPGALKRKWSENGRDYFHYVSDARIRNDLAIYSAVYDRRVAQWNDVAIEVLFHPNHAWNADRTVRGVRESLGYLTREFGPYRQKTVRLVEYPGSVPTLHAYPVNVSYQEGFARLNPDTDPRNIDFVFAVVAHEMAHHWWGHQVTPARVEGGAILSESLAWYSALCVVGETFGASHLDGLLGLLRAAYGDPRSRGGVPLMCTSDTFDAYRKGPFAMYAMREYVGVDRINAALRRLIERFADGSPPLATTLDLYSELKAVAPDSLHYLLTDLFERNTFWDLRARNVTAERNGSGWRVTLEAVAQKIVADTAGVETTVPMNDLIEVGVYGDSNQVLYKAMHRIRSGEQRIVVDVAGRPVRASLDPRHLMIDTDPVNNTVQIRN